MAAKECHFKLYPGLQVPNSPYSFCGHKATLNCSILELWSCVKVEVDVLGSPSLIVLMVSVDVKQHSACVGPYCGSTVAYDDDVVSLLVR